MNKFDALSQLDLMIIEGLHRGLFDDRLGRVLMNLADRGIMDNDVSGHITSRVLGDLRREAFRLYPFSKPKLFGGKLVFGFTIDGESVTIEIQWLNAGLLEVAGPGGGKTNRTAFLSAQIALQVKGMWVFDLRKAEFRFLAQALANRGINLRIVRGRKFKFNPLQVPSGIDPHIWAAQTADLLVKVLNLPPRASNLLTSSILKLYKKDGILNGSMKFPTLFELFEAIKSAQDANFSARQAVLDALELVLLSLGWEVLGYEQGWTMEQLAREKLVIELAMLPETAKDLILNWMIQSEFTRRIIKGISNPQMDLWIAFDEGQRTFSQHKDQQSANGNAITDQAGLVRGTGIGLSVSILTTTDLSSAIPNLTSTKIMGRCGSIGEYTTAGHFMGLNQEQILWCAHHLVPGMFVGQVSEGAWRYPFLFKVPLFDKTNLVPLTDEQADATIADMDAGRIVHAVRVADVVEIDGEEDVLQQEQEPAIELTDAQLKILKAVVKSPMRVSSDYVKLAKVSPNTLAKARHILVAKGLIAEHLSEANERGRSARRWEPLDAAIEIVNKHSKGGDY